MYTLRFSNSAGRPQFADLKDKHESLDSVALEILRLREKAQDSGAYNAIVEDGDGNDVTHLVPTASRTYENAPRGGVARNPTGGAVVYSNVELARYKVTRVGDKEISRQYIGPAV